MILNHPTLVIACIVNVVLATSPLEWAVNKATLFETDIFYLDLAQYQQQTNMATITEVHSSWHPGEEEMHRLLHIPRRENPTSHGLAASYGYRVMNSPLVAFGTLDRKGRPWTTLWGGEAGFCRPIANSVLGVRATADAQFDPVLHELFAQETEGPEGAREIKDEELVRPEGGKLMAGLAIDLETRDRVKIAGRFMAGAVSKTEPGMGELQMAFQVQESLGNCPKYLNKKQITPHIPTPRLVSEASGLPLPEEAVELIKKSDLFFISSKHGNGSQSMDTNHRGGPPGFMRVFKNEAPANGGVTVVYPEYSGNRLYQTLGNLQEDPYAGIVVPDFETGDVLYLTGRTTILIGDKAAAYLSHTKLAVKIDVEEARFVKDGLAFRGSVIDYSPYNPPVRPLIAEQDLSAPEAGSSALASATLITREEISPSISRFVFSLSHETDEKGARKQVAAWHPGQHITLDFGPELDHGWEHMRDSDPQSLNDDFIRTFTVSAPLDPGAIDETGHLKVGANPEVEITVRKHGPATALLWRWNLRVPLELPVLGFGGSEEFRIPVAANQGADPTESVFVAGGVGITPLMAQAKGVLDAEGGHSLALLWSLRGEDLPLAVKVLEKFGQKLGNTTRIFVTGQIDEKGQAAISRLEKLGSQVRAGRMDRQDVLGPERAKRRFFCCTGPEMMKDLLKWTEGEKVVFESFQY
jgi:hypothetical protein